jgi:hypothetical protein
MKKFLTTLALTGAIITGAQAQTNSFTGTFTFDSSSGTNIPFAYNGTAISDVTVGALNKIGITNTSSTRNFRGSFWALDDTPVGSLTGTVDLGKYMEFGLTAASGFTLNMTDISFGVGRSGTGPRQWEWRSSIDNYLAPIASYSTNNAGLTESLGVLTNPDANSAWTGNVLDLSGGGFDNLTSVTFRLYGYNAEGTAGTGGLQGPLTFSGATVVPEPSTYALLALSGAGLAAYRLRRRARR